MKVLHTVTELVATAVHAAPGVSGAPGNAECGRAEQLVVLRRSRGGLCITLLPTYLCGTQLNKTGWFFCINSTWSERKVVPCSIKALDFVGIIPFEQSSPSKATFAFLHLNIANVPAVDPRFWDVSW